MEKTFYLFRHALSTRSNQGYGDLILTATILPEETPPIERMGEYLKTLPDGYNISSDLLRCRQTAEIITKVTGRQFVFDPRLREMVDETFAAVRGRVENILAEFNSRPEEHIFVCTHGVVIAAIKRFLLNGDFVENDQNDYPLCGELVIIQGKNVNYLDFNQIPPTARS